MRAKYNKKQSQIFLDISHPLLCSGQTKAIKMEIFVETLPTQKYEMRDITMNAQIWNFFLCFIIDFSW